MHLLVVFTGGTIGSSETDGVLAAGAGVPAVCCSCMRKARAPARG